MASALAIVSKAVFEKQAPGAAVGSVIAIDQYASTHKALAPLANGGSLFLVTVRPPDEQLWLVAVLENPTLAKDGWKSPPNRVPIADLRFTTGTGKARGRVGASEPVPKVAGPLLAQAATHLAAGRITAAIDAMLVRWREIRVPALADLIERATRLMPTYDRPIAMTVKQTREAWMSAFERNPAEAMPQLLQNVNSGGTKLAELRIAQLATLPDDPRIAIASRRAVEPTRCSRSWM